jgi:hypothetical protein
MQWEFVTLLVTVVVQAALLVYTFGRLVQRVEGLEQNFNRLWTIVLRRGHIEEE